MKKRIFVVFLTTVLMFGVFDVAYGETTENTVAAQSTSATIVDSGKCGDNVTYTLDSDGLLTISGSGYIYMILTIRNRCFTITMILKNCYRKRNNKNRELCILRM